MVRWVLLVVTAAAACASGRSADGPNGGGGTHDAPPGSQSDGSMTMPVDARPPDASSPPGDAPPGGGGSGLDPDLEIPDPSGQVCDEPGRIGSPECPAAEVCRYFTSTEGRCEACGSGCGNLNAPCTATNQCDILFECYQGHCVGFCTLGSVECGAPADCVNIGHATRGVCRPL